MSGGAIAAFLMMQRESERARQSSTPQPFNNCTSLGSISIAPLLSYSMSSQTDLHAQVKAQQIEIDELKAALAKLTEKSGG